VIVESPAKAKTIRKFLGGNYVIEASIGHIRDLPENRKQLPEDLQKKDWAYLGVDVHRDFQPHYVVSPDRRDQVRKLKGLVKNASELYLATDEDREGEAISWHLVEVLQPKVPVRRMVFHEITKNAIQDALQNPRGIDNDLVRAQETRRILDRLYGYDVSNFLWRKMGGIAKSAGRVQSVAVRMVVERELERMAFRPANYWDLLGAFAPDAGQAFEAQLVRVGERRLATGRDFDPATGKLKDASVLQLDEPAATALAERLRGGSFRVTSVEETPYTSRPYAPFTTSTMQQEASRKLRFPAQRTMQLAQSLYQNGYITYMRTDSTVLSSEAITAARSIVQTLFGAEYLPEQPRVYSTKVRNAQEAHEAIRPAGTSFRTPEELRGEISNDELKLYDLIWKRTVASQMNDAKMRSVTVTIEAQSSGETAAFQATGKSIDFPGYLRAYVEGSDDPEAELADREVTLPKVASGQALLCRSLEPKGHTTQPPARFTEATLTRALEERGIGRPSTYASILSTIVERNYVFKRGAALVPTWTAMAMVNLMAGHLPDLVDYQFTARMEDDLDAISRGESGHVDYLRTFYYGSDSDGLKHLVQNKLGEVDIREVCRFRVGRPGDAAPSIIDQPHDDDETIYLRVGKFGPYLQQGERRATVPEDLAPDEVTIEKALDLLAHAARADEPLGICPKTHKPVFLKSGRFGPYVQLGAAEDGEKPKMASLLRGMSPADLTLETALRILDLPRELGVHPETGAPVVAHNGRFGPYVKCGHETRSLPSDISPLDVTLEQALQLLAQPKYGRRGQPQRSREPLKVLGASPVTGKEVRVMDGRYGKYVTDGQTNATLPRDTSPEDVTLDRALDLLAERAARGPAKRGRRRFKSGGRWGGSRRADSRDAGEIAAATGTRTKRPKRAARSKASAAGRRSKAS
jgi:DNA topoisomerase-1